MRETSLRTIVADNVRVGMVRRRAKQADLAQSLGMSQQALSRRLTEGVAFDTDELEAIAAYLEVPLEQLLAPAEAEAAS